MGYRSLLDCILDLRRHGHLVEIQVPVDPYLEMAAIQRRIYAAQGPAIWFRNVQGSPFSAVSNLYGTFARTEFIFRDTLSAVQKIIALKGDPSLLVRKPGTYLGSALSAFKALPVKARSGAPVMHDTTTLFALPQIVSWPKDGGAFVTLPQVLTFPPGETDLMKANLGMYRIQISGNDYIKDVEAGMHYQIHRGIGIHHAQYNTSDEPFRVSIFVGGPPAHSVAAVMPLPEGLSELTFAGMLAGRRFRYLWKDQYCISADADFCITGTVEKGTLKPEGPFGDHLGYYSLQHPFPVLKINKIYHRKDAIWHFTIVGRPPQEDTSFGHLIHELVTPLLSKEFPGISEIRAVDASGVHPLLLAIGSERYMPFRERRPEEILTQANHLLGKGQTSLAKYLLIAASGDNPGLSTQDIPGFLSHVLERFDPARDLHFQTQTTIDTLDYSGTDLNAGSKLILAACGEKKRVLATSVPMLNLPGWVRHAALATPGVLALTCPPFSSVRETEREVRELENSVSPHFYDRIPLILLVDDAKFVAASFNNFLWVTFTRSNPSHDVHGFRAFTEHKHWGCRGPLVIDARAKPHHAPVLEEDPEVTRLADRHFRKGGALEQWG